MVRTKGKLGGNVMDNKEAIQLLDKLLLRGDFSDQYGDMEDSSPYEEAVKIAKQAIEKQIPKKFVGRLSTLDINCPCCNGEDIYDIPNRRIVKQNYCPNCGQALDWSSENE